MLMQYDDDDDFKRVLPTITADVGDLISSISRPVLSLGDST